MGIIEFFLLGFLSKIVVNLQASALNVPGVGVEKIVGLRSVEGSGLKVSI